MEKNIVRKVKITYKMIRGKNDNEIAEAYIELPISQRRYDQLLEGLSETNKAWTEVREALVTLTRLQGYEKLGAWSIELEIEGLKELLNKC